MDEIAGVSLTEAVQHRRLVQILQLTDVLGQVQSRAVLLLHIVLVDGQLFPIVHQAEAHLVLFLIPARCCRRQANGGSEAAAMHQPYTLRLAAISHVRLQIMSHSSGAALASSSVAVLMAALRKDGKQTKQNTKIELNWGQHFVGTAHPNFN